MTFALGLLPLANAIFRGDRPLEVNQFSQGEQMEYVGQAVHQLVRENYLKRTVFQDFGQTVLREGLSVEEINAFFISHFEYAQRRFTGWLQGSVTSPPLMAEFDSQLVALYKVKIKDAQMRIQIGMVLDKRTSTPVKAPRREDLPTTQNRDKEKPGAKKKLAGKEKQIGGKEKQIPRAYFEELKKMLSKPDCSLIDGSQIEQVLPTDPQAPGPPTSSPPRCAAAPHATGVLFPGVALQFPLRPPARTGSPVEKPKYLPEFPQRGHFPSTCTPQWQV